MSFLARHSCLLVILFYLASCGGTNLPVTSGKDTGTDLRVTTQVMFPPINSQVTAEKIIVRGMSDIQSGSIKELYVAGYLATTSDQYKHWQAEVPLQIGTNTLNIEVVGNSGRRLLTTGAQVLRSNLVQNSSLPQNSLNCAQAHPADSLYQLDKDTLYMASRTGDIYSYSLTDGQSHCILNAAEDTDVDFVVGADNIISYDADSNVFYLGSSLFRRILSRIDPITKEVNVLTHLGDLRDAFFDIAFDYESNRILIAHLFNIQSYTVDGSAPATPYDAGFIATADNPSDITIELFSLSKSGGAHYAWIQKKSDREAHAISPFFNGVIDFDNQTTISYGATSDGIQVLDFNSFSIDEENKLLYGITSARGLVKVDLKKDDATLDILLSRDQLASAGAIVPISIEVDEARQLLYIIHSADALMSANPTGNIFVYDIVTKQTADISLLRVALMK